MREVLGKCGRGRTAKDSSAQGWKSSSQETMAEAFSSSIIEEQLGHLAMQRIRFCEGEASG